MSTVFDNYSKYYDLLYRDKDYAAEVEYILTQIGRYAPNAERILELGCGTGTHSELFAKRGLTVHGVDLSETMLSKAHARKDSLPKAVGQRMTFSLGDVRSIRLHQRFDVVLSLFHVMSYQTTDADLDAALASAAAHLKPGGLVLFDFWYGPAVLTQRPDVRVKRLTGDGVRITRIAEPVLHAAENVVDVNYELWIENSDGAVKRIVETHRMRYWFAPELNLHLLRIGFKNCVLRGWLSEQPPGAQSWAACATAIWNG